MNRKNQLIIYAFAVLCMSLAMGMHDSLFNNFLSDTFKLSAEQRGSLEMPRELPGFLVVVMAGILAALPITSVGIVGTAMLAAGLIGLSLFGSSYAPMIMMMLLASAGMHLLQPIGSTIVLGLSDEKNKGKRMGQVGSMETTGTIIGASIIAFFFSKTHPQYQRGFLIAGLIVCISVFLYTRLHIPHLHGKRSRITFKKKYSLYYIIELIFGARKQIFITFGPWALIKIYGYPATSIAILYMIGAIIGVFFKPAIGLLIDKFGERKLMIADGLILSLVCLGYGYASFVMKNPVHARILASACFVLDNLLFALTSARIIYLSRISPNHEELNSTLAMGISINHIVSMIIPVYAGMLWVSFGYEKVFLAAAGLSLIQSFTSTFVPRKKQNV